VGAGRRGLLLACEPAAGREVLRGLLRAEAAHRRRPQAVLASAEQWLGEELHAFFGVVDVGAQVLQFACRGAAVAYLCGTEFRVDELTGRHDDLGIALEGDETLLAASGDAEAADPETNLLEALGLHTGAMLRVDVGQLVRRVDEETLTLRLPGAPDACIGRTEEVAARSGLDEKGTYRLVAAVTEAVDNAERYAYEGRGDGMIEVRYLVTEDDLIVQVSDTGRGFDAAAAEPAFVDGGDLFRESGRGFQIMRRFADAVEVDSAAGRGTVVRLEKGRHRVDGN
jgi:anti-sigma regulatory factor (Ser/Thr protein kinase)